MRNAGLVSLLFVLACGGDEPIVQGGAAAAGRSAATIPVTETTGVVHEVRMMGTVELGFRFEPADLTVRVGDTIRWINRSGFPHNVAFDADSIPRGAETVINAVMPADGKLGPMIGGILREAGQTFEMDFVNVPLGRYPYFSVVQEAVGMAGSIIVEAGPAG